MSSASSKETERFALVSSFYGPGATIGWYLTALSCVILFGLHPRKRKADDITVDLIATLVFPSVAAGDLISHVHSYSRTKPSTRDGRSEQRSACTEASLVVIESFLAIDIILFLLAVGFKCIRRGCLLAAAGLFCFAAECYLSFSSHVGYTIYEYLDRSFLVTFRTLLIILLVTLSILATYAIGLLILYFVMPLPKAELEATDEVGELARKLEKQQFVGSHTMRLTASMTMLSLPLCFLGTSWPLCSSVFTDLPPQLMPWLRAAGSNVRRGLVPNSNIHVKELDQVVALLAGATVLCINLYNVANSYHEAWILRTKETQQRREVELRWLAERRIELVRFGHLHTRSGS